MAQPTAPARTAVATPLTDTFPYSPSVWELSGSVQPQCIRHAGPNVIEYFEACFWPARRIHCLRLDLCTRMASPELQDSWRRTTAFLRDARSHLSEAAEGICADEIAEFEDYLSHNELELALDSLEAAVFKS